MSAGPSSIDAHLVSYGHVADHGISAMHNSADILRSCNKVLDSALSWHTYLCSRKHHWTVLLCPECQSLDVESFKVEVDCLQAKFREECIKNSPDDVYHSLQASQLILAFDLVVSQNKAEETFFSVRMEVHPNFDLQKKEVSYRGLSEASSLESLADHAERTIRSFDSYGKLGANCQHFAIEFLKAIGADSRGLVAEDQRLAQAAGGAVGAAYVAGGAVKAGVTYFVVGGSALALGHIGLGVAIAGGAYVATRRGYDMLAKRHRSRTESDL